MTRWRLPLTLWPIPPQHNVAFVRFEFDPYSIVNIPSRPNPWCAVEVSLMMTIAICCFWSYSSCPNALHVADRKECFESM